VSSVESGWRALEVVVREIPDLIILDLKLPDLSGEEICKIVRETLPIQPVPILILTGLITEGLPARCLNGGADDYVSKPFDLKELVARVRALLRRPPLDTGGNRMIQRGRIAIRVAERQVLWDGRRVQNLAPKEFELLSHLVLQAPKVVYKNALAAKAWGAPLERLHKRTLDVHVRRIRQKLGPAAAGCLKTVPAIGYQWLDDSTSSKSSRSN
jgi:DNA-binding response OmpR family regulator